MSLSFTKYSNTLDILLLRTNMSEWNVWVTMPQVAAATSLPNTLQQQTALSRSVRLYLSRQHCISGRVPSISTASSFQCVVHSVYTGVANLQLVAQVVASDEIVANHMSSLERYWRQHWKTIFLFPCHNPLDPFRL